MVHGVVEGHTGTHDWIAYSRQSLPEVINEVRGVHASGSHVHAVYAVALVLSRCYQAGWYPTVLGGLSVVRVLPQEVIQ